MCCRPVASEAWRKNIKRILGACQGCEPYNLAWEVMKKQGFDVYNIDIVYRAHTAQGERLDELVNFFVNEFMEWPNGSQVKESGRR